MRLYILMALQYTLIIAWFITSLAIGTVLVRMSCWMVMTVQTCIFAISLHKLRNLIASVNREENDKKVNEDEATSFTTNVPLLRCNQYIYMATILPFMFLFFVACSTNGVHHLFAPDATRASCIDFILTDAAFFTVQLSNIPRAIVSCYMNLQFAQTIEEANR